MVQIGDFNWAKKQDAIPRRANPLLLAWPMNNYWETNFRANQPGEVEFRYSFASHGAFDPARAVQEGQDTWNPPVTHLVMDDGQPRGGRFLDVQGDSVVVLHAKPADDGQGLIVRLINLGAGTTQARISLPGRTIAGAWVCNTLEENRDELEIAGGAAACELPPRQVTTVRLNSR
jgi:alpha-mannosidase